MKKKFLGLFLLFVLNGAFAAKCENNLIGQPVCAPPNGGIAKDIIGTPVCGKGECVVDLIGRVMCAKNVGGAAAKDIIEQPVCSGGCEQATQQTCDKDMRR